MLPMAEHLSQHLAIARTPCIRKCFVRNARDWGLQNKLKPCMTGSYTSIASTLACYQLRRASTHQADPFGSLRVCQSYQRGYGHLDDGKSICDRPTRTASSFRRTAASNGFRHDRGVRIHQKLACSISHTSARAQYLLGMVVSWGIDLTARAIFVISTGTAVWPTWWWLADFQQQPDWKWLLWLKGNEMIALRDSCVSSIRETVPAKRQGHASWEETFGWPQCEYSAEQA